MPEHVWVVVSGVTYEAAIAGSDVPAAECWPVPEHRRRGRGCQYVYRGLTPEQAEQIISHLEQVYGSALGWDDEGGARDRAALLRDIRRGRGRD